MANISAQFTGFFAPASPAIGRLVSPLRTILCAGAIPALLAGCQAGPDQDGALLVRTQAEYEQAVQNAKPGDTITLANGVWKDFEIVFTGEGTADAPITLTAETKGEVILSGQSNLKLAGTHLLVSGLVFKDGYSPSSNVISFRTSKTDLARHSRVTQIVIDDYNPPQRNEVSFWVMMYGRHNRFDHNILTNKRNAGVTMAVRMDTEDSRENYHRIDHNYFGPRQILGSNGGETLRIGTSHYSLSSSYTKVENNYFDRADGEVEIISSKSGHNDITGNTFFESRGTLTLRHGNHARVQGNVFFGNGEDHTGGIRVINGDQTITGNYMEGLKGTRFGGAFVVMNGVPNSPINRYHQVKNANISNNSIINADNILLGAGSDSERSAAPVDSVFANNLIYNADGRNPFILFDDMSGIEFKDNLVSAPNPKLPAGFAPINFELSRAENGLLYGPTDAGAPKDLAVTTKDMTGPDWYPKTEPVAAFGSGKTINISPGQNAVFGAVQNAQAGDIIQLAPGDYTEEKMVVLDKPLTFASAGGAHLSYERSSLFQINSGGALQLIRLNISGKDAPDYAGNTVIRTSPYAMLENYRIDIQDTDFTDLDVNHSYSVISGAKGTFADRISLKNVNVSDVSGGVIKLDREDDDYGIYNAEYIDIEDSAFENIGWGVLSVYRGGTDESTFGPHVTITGSRFDGVGFDKRNKKAGSLYLHGVQATQISGNTFKNSKPFIINHTVGEPKTFITDNAFAGTPAPVVTELNSGLPDTSVQTGNTGLSGGKR